jgi:hypothetical protein
MPRLTSLPKLAIGYVRVSTPQQVTGLQLQTEKIHQFARQHNVSVPMIFDDEGSAMSSDVRSRGGLLSAVQEAGRRGAPIIVSDATRLSRAPSLTRSLIETFDIEVIAVDDGRLLALGDLIKREERGHEVGTSIRSGTRKALAWRTSPTLNNASEEARRAGGRRGCINNGVGAEDLARTISQVLEVEDPHGLLSRAGVAKLLNDRGVRTRQGGDWSKEDVRRQLKRARGRLALEADLAADDFSDF